MENTWYKLDNAAKIYPAIRQWDWSPIFRVDAVLKETIIPELLQNALVVTYKRFPTFAVHMVKGLFWYYFEPNDSLPEVREEDDYPCRPFSDIKEKGYLFRVLYFKKRVSLEIFHSITDGFGATVFLKTLIFNYLNLVKGQDLVEKPLKLDSYGILYHKDLPTVEETDDAVKCANCKVEISYLSSNCPFCGKFLIKSSIEDELKYPDMRELSFRKYDMILRLLLFFAITSSIILFTINLLTYDINLWSVVPISAIWLLIPDAVTGKDEWAMSYVVPFVLSGSSFIITIIVLLKKLTWKELYLFQLSIAAICFIPIVARVFFVFVFWPSIFSAVYGLITIVAMSIFSDKNLKFESKKRFHF